MRHWYYTEWSKSPATKSWHMFCVPENKLHWNQETKNNVILSVGNAHRFQRCMHSLFSSCLMQPGEEFLQWPETVHQTIYCRFVWHRRIGKCIPKLILASLTMNTLCICEKDIIAIRLFEDSWRTGASRLHHEVTCVGSCIVTAILCVY
jgi:hypothetical protein